MATYSWCVEKLRDEALALGDDLMKRNCYESYDYVDPDNLYTDPGSSVLEISRKKRELEYRVIASKEFEII